MLRYLVSDMVDWTCLTMPFKYGLSLPLFVIPDPNIDIQYPSALMIFFRFCILVLVSSLLKASVMIGYIVVHNCSII